MTRKEFIQLGLMGAISMTLSQVPAEAGSPLPEPSASKLPKWRGFNLLEKFMVHSNSRFRESDFAWMAEWGFNFVRLPMDYRCWIQDGDWTRIREDTLKEIDEAVEFGRRHGVHVCINFHRAPGYTVASPKEALSVWHDEEARRVCALHWGTFAKRYAGVPNRNLSFNLFNEPAGVGPADYRDTVQRMLEAIRAHDAHRLVICDGREWGNVPPTELAGMGVAAATRGYQPMQITHYKASWVGGSDKWPVPQYPLRQNGFVWDRDTMRTRLIEPWKKLEAQGVGVMVGEFGAFNQTPHDVVLRWMHDLLSLWKEAGWGWALWNLRGSFGILDSDRADVVYEDFRGHKLDRQMLDLLRRY